MTFKEVGSDKQIKLDKSNLSLIDGTYANCAIDDDVFGYPKYDLWSSIFTGGPDVEEQNFCRVILKANKKGSINAKLMLENRVLKERTIRGKIKNGYFYRRPLFYLIPFFPIAGSYNCTRSRIGITSGYIIVDQKASYGGMFIGFGANTKFNHRKRFVKK